MSDTTSVTSKSSSVLSSFQRFSLFKKKSEAEVLAKKEAKRLKLAKLIEQRSPAHTSNPRRIPILAESKRSYYTVTFS
jgi:hypothetical protein